MIIFALILLDVFLISVAVKYNRKYKNSNYTKYYDESLFSGLVAIVSTIISCIYMFTTLIF